MSDECSCADGEWWCNVCLQHLGAAVPQKTIMINRIRPRLPIFIDPADLESLALSSQPRAR